MENNFFITHAQRFRATLYPSSCSTTLSFYHLIKGKSTSETLSNKEVVFNNIPCHDYIQVLNSYKDNFILSFINN